MDKRGDWNKSYTLWATIVHSISPFFQNNAQDPTGGFSSNCDFSYYILNLFKIIQMDIGLWVVVV